MSNKHMRHMFAAYKILLVSDMSKDLEQSQTSQTLLFHRSEKLLDDAPCLSHNIASA